MANRYHLFKHIKGRFFKNVLSIGGAFGHELLPIKAQLGNVTIMESSAYFAANSDIYSRLHAPVRYIKPLPTGELPFSPCTFDLILCLGVLHHLPNITKFISQIFRCLNDDGIVLIRDPIFSMGDWTRKRKDLTPHERGIPPRLFINMIKQAKFTILHRSYAYFQPFLALFTKIALRNPYRHKVIVVIDHVFSKLFAGFNRYHRESIWDKISPTAIFFVLKK